MTRKRLSSPTVDRHLDIYESDWEFIEANFGRSSPRRFGAAKFIREVIHLKVKALRAKQIEALDALSPGEEAQDRALVRELKPEVSSDEIL